MIKAIIFDMDGVISDTQKIHSKVEAELLNRYGYNFTPEDITQKYAGVRTTEFFGELLKGKEQDIAGLLNKKQENMIKLAKQHVDPMPGIFELIAFAKTIGPIAVASASDMNYVQTVLTTLKIQDKFESITSSEEVKKGKPAPDTFLLAAKRINTKPENCLVIEDGISGMIAAKKAGMKCIGLVPDRNAKDKYPATILVESLKEINKELVERL